MWGENRVPHSRKSVAADRKIVWLRTKNRLAQKIKGEKRTVKDSI